MSLNRSRATNLQNVDKTLFPRKLKLIGEIGEERFAVKWRLEKLPAGYSFVNMFSDHENNRYGVSETPEFEKKVNGFRNTTSPEEYDEINYELTNDEFADDDSEEESNPARAYEEVPPATYFIICDGVGMVTTDKLLAEKISMEMCCQKEDTPYYFYCQELQSKLSVPQKGQVPLSRRR